MRKEREMAEYCDERVCLFVCVFICLFVCLSASISPELHVRSFSKFFACYLMAVARSDFGSVAKRYSCVG